MRSTYFDTNTRAIIDVDPEFDPGIRRIARMNVPIAFRNKGIGTRLMQELCLDADADNITLVLEPIPYDGPDKLPDLLRFYGRFGFAFDPQTGCRREPKIWPNKITADADNTNKASL